MSYNKLIKLIKMSNLSVPFIDHPPSSRMQIHEDDYGGTGLTLNMILPAPHPPF